MNKHVFLIDDSDDHQELLRILFENEGYKFSCASNGQQALEWLQSKCSNELPGLIILDLMMPVMDGYAFKEEQDKDPLLASIPVVIMTADGNIQSKTMKLNGRGFIEKPVDIDRLLELAQQFCG